MSLYQKFRSIVIKPQIFTIRGDFFARGLNRDEYITERTKFIKKDLDPDNPLLLEKNLKKCNKCKKIKRLNDFNVLFKSKDGLQHVCIECVSDNCLARENKPKYNKERKTSFTKDQQLLNLEKISDKLRIRFYGETLPEGLIKLCTHCKLPKNISEFTKSKQSPDGFGSVCYAHRSSKNKFSFTSYKNKAYYSLKKAIKEGKLEPKQACESCNKVNVTIEAHHEDYSKPLQVKWLCVPCHSEWHNKFAFFKLIINNSEGIKETVNALCPVNYGYFQYAENGILSFIAVIVDKTFYKNNKECESIKDFMDIELTKPIDEEKVYIDLIVLDDITDAGVGYYTITHKSTGCVYVGSTSNFRRRKKEHISELKRGVNNSWRLQEKVNEDPVIYFEFFPTETIDIAKSNEIEIIKNFPDRSKLLNIEFNDDKSSKIRMSESKKGNKNGLGYRFSEEAKRKMSERRKGNTYRKGIKHTPEIKRIIRDKLKGRKLTKDQQYRSSENRTKKRIRVGSLLYRNAAAAAKELGLSADGVIKRCKSPRFQDYSLVDKCDKYIFDTEIYSTKPITILD